ncbi:MAG TPA: maleylpyruvate isomerase family mycothiol-dependent enzyme [Acidimicrobiia bacterium]|nr:maleylpyruvate isomerase family mycothiol-dependent enzyme [Acidimicrobiia bacterium]
MTTVDASSTSWAELLDALNAQHAELASIVDGRGAGAWEKSTRCEGWDVGAVLLHLAQTDELAVESASGALDGFAGGFLGASERQAVTVDEAAAAQVDVQRAAGGDAIRARWHAASVAMQSALADGDPHRRVTWVSGLLSIQTLTATRVSECWIHTGDIADGLGVEVPPTDRLRFVARLAWRTLPYAFMRDEREMTGPVAMYLTGPNGHDWRFEPDEPALTTIRGSAVEFCDVAARRVDARETALIGEGPDAADVLRLVRTYAL